MCGQHNVRASAEDNTGQNTKDTHPIPGQKLKFLTPPGIEPGPPGLKAGTLPTTPWRRIIFFLKLHFLFYLFFFLQAGEADRLEACNVLASVLGYMSGKCPGTHPVEGGSG